MTVEVRNRQRRKVNTARLRQLATNTVAVLCERQGAGTAVIDRRYNLSIALVNDREMARLNQQFHSTPGPTDVLTFDYGDGEAEIIISVDHAFAHPRPARELALYLVHGILHLQGYDDHTPAQRRRMRAAERRLLARVIPASIRR
jgi:probable rRNA maturation factor